MSKLVSPEEINLKLYRYEKLAEYEETSSGLGDAQVPFYKVNGYVAIKNLLNESEVREAIDGIMEILSTRRSMSREQFDAHYTSRMRVDKELLARILGPAASENMKPSPPFVQLVKPENELQTPEQWELAMRKAHNYVCSEQRLLTVAAHPEILRIAELLLGEKPMLVQDMALLKPPRGGGEKPWHQDMAYRGLDFEKPVVGVWIALDKAEVDNGCMHIIPRSHMLGCTPHYAVRDWQICDENVQVERDVVVPLPPGGALFFHGLLHHGTPSNFTETRRRALQFHYAPANSKLVPPDEHKRMFTNEWSGAQC